MVAGIQTGHLWGPQWLPQCHERYTLKTLLHTVIGSTMSRKVHPSDHVTVQGSDEREHSDQDRMVNPKHV